jgi:uncharacterized protein YbaP (TraB family)
MRRPIPRPVAAAALALAALAGAAAPACAAPAWWRISDGRAEVWVLGAPRITPRALAWDTSGVERRLAGASQLIVDVQPRGGLKAIAVLISGAGSPRPMEDGLPPALRRRFEAVSGAIGQDPRRYASWKPAVAGVMLAGDVYKAEDLKAGEVEKTVRSLARKAGVREAPAGAYDVADMAGAAEALPPPGQQLCLSATLKGLEAGPARLADGAADWARGDPRPAAPDPADLACLAAMPGVKALNERNLEAEASALAAALKAPGRSVAVLDLQQLAMPHGVLDRLRAQGLAVSGPLP